MKPTLGQVFTFSDFHFGKAGSRRAEQCFAQTLPRSSAAASASGLARRPSRHGEVKRVLILDDA